MDGRRIICYITATSELPSLTFDSSIGQRLLFELLFAQSLPTMETQFDIA